MATAIDIQDVSKFYRTGGQRIPALSGITLRIEPGELFFLLGPSGCGKTTLLRMIAGFLAPTSGAVLFDGRNVSHIPPNKRNTGMVFQSYALWPHMTVAANVGFGLGIRRVPAAERERRVAEALDAVRMRDFAKRKPNELSGGQQQRVALARALVIRPDVLLLDEPLSNLDSRLRMELRSEIRAICKHYSGGMTTVYVTHDQQEALSMADRIALLRDGNVVQVDDPRALYFAPRSVFAGGFLGTMNFVACGLLERNGDQARISSRFGEFDVRCMASGRGPFLLAIRPESLQIWDTSDDSALARPCSRVTVSSTTFLGESSHIEVGTMDGHRLQIATRGRSTIAKPGSSVFVGFDPADCVLLDDEGATTARVTQREEVAA